MIFQQLNIHASNKTIAICTLFPWKRISLQLRNSCNQFTSQAGVVSIFCKLSYHQLSQRRPLSVWSRQRRDWKNPKAIFTVRHCLAHADDALNIFTRNVSLAWLFVSEKNIAVHLWKAVLKPAMPVAIHTVINQALQRRIAMYMVQPYSFHRTMPMTIYNLQAIRQLTGAIDKDDEWMAIEWPL